jgi:PAS domain S-box-containing protein
LLIPSDSRKNFPEILEDAEQLVLSVLDALSAHVAILNADGTIIAVNRAWRRYAEFNRYDDPNYGVDINYITVCEAAANLNAKDALSVADGLRDVIAGKIDEYQLEYPCHNPTEQRWFIVRMSRFIWENEVRVIVAHQDVSELKQAQIELSESNHRLEAILDNINNGIVTLNRKGMIETANQAAARIFDYSSDELIGKALESLLDESFDGKMLNQDFSNEKGYELTGLRQDGSTFPMYFAMNELRFGNNSIYTCIIQDITEIIEHERMQVDLEKERELRTLKNHFLSMMGHELNTPLTSIGLSYDMLKKYRHLSTDEKNEQALDNIQQQVGHLRDMIKDMMTLSRSEAEGLEIDPEDVDLITYCRDVIEEFQFTYYQTHRVQFQCEAIDIRAQIDRRNLRRVFTNLLSNAIKYSPNGGEILFHLSHNPEADEARIAVSDSGIGIPEEDIPRLFEAFHRAKNADGLAGTGLGLAIVKQIVELHHGRVTFESKMGQGTTFIIYLPLHQLNISA